MKKHLVQELTERCLICDQAVWVSGYENNRHHVGYDAKFCRACDTWLESTCPDPRCQYCSRRPNRPSLIPYADVVCTFGHLYKALRELNRRS